MNLLSRMLVCTDFSSASEDAIRMALILAQKFRSHLTLLHVIPGREKELPIALVKAKEASFERMTELKKKWKTGESQIDELVVTNGAPFDQITRWGEEKNASTRSSKS